MEFINQLIPDEILYALGWTVVHSMWQAFAVALLLGSFLLGWQKKSARHRYYAGVVSLGLTFGLTLVTFFVLVNGHEPSSAKASVLLADDGTVLGRYFIEEKRASFFQNFEENLPLVVTFWLAGLVFFLLKMLGGLIYIERLKHRNVTLMSDYWQAKLALLANSLKLSKVVVLAESSIAQVPMVVGWLKPIILMPIGAVANLSPEQIEAILAHELAHIRRNDYLLNLFQTLVEILFYFNPAVWWISANIRTERENCCDDLAVQLCGSSLIYAKALVSLQEIQHSVPVLAMPFSKNKNQLLTRIKRILQPPQSKSNVMEKLTATLMLLAAVLMLSVQANTPLGRMFDRVICPTPSPMGEDVRFFNSDTIPHNRGNTYLHQNNNGEEVEVIMNEGQITYLKINGEEIPEEKYEEYEGMIDQLLAEAPEAPAPPDFDLEMPAPPAPPFPPAFEEMPAPPAPPAPPAFGGGGTRKITTTKDGKETTIIIESMDGTEPVEIRMKEGKNGVIIINGQEIKGLKKGDQTVIIDQTEGNGSYFWGNGQNGKLFAFPGQENFLHLGELNHLFRAPEIAELDYLRGEVLTFPRFDEEELKRWNEAQQQYAEEWQERLSNGSLNEEWMEDFNQQMAEHRLQIKEIQEQMAQEMAKARAGQDETRMKNLKHWKEQESARLQELRAMEEQMQEQFRQHKQQNQRLLQKQKVERERSRKKLIKYSTDDGRM